MKKKPTSLLIKPRVVVDTNVFISAFIWGGNPAKIINLWKQEMIELIISPFLFSEIILVFERFEFPQKDLELLQQILEEKSSKFLPKRKTKICRDKKDNQVLDLCLSGKADFLITGDKDLLELKQFRQTKIIKPRDFLEEFQLKISPKKCWSLK